MTRFGVSLVAAILLSVSSGGEPANAQDGARPAIPAKRVRPGEDPSVMLDRANHFAVQGRCEDAVPILEKLVSEYPQVSAANEMLAQCYLKIGRAHDAATLLEKCLAEEPDRLSYLRDLGRAYIDAGQKEKGLETWRRIIKDDEKYAAAYGAIAKMEQEAGLYDEAVATLRAGKRFKEYADYYSREIVRLERLLGRNEEAFREALLLLGGRPGTLEGELRNVADIFKESANQGRLVSIVDSLSAAESDTSGVLRALAAVFLAETGRYDEMRAQLLGKGAPGLREEELSSLLGYLGRMADRRSDERFRAVQDETMRAYLERYGSSFLAPGVMLAMASSKREAAWNAGAEREKLLAEAIALAEEAERHRHGAAYLERAALFKARVLFDDMRGFDEALKELDGVRWRSEGAAAEAAELRIRILIASGNRAEAEKRLTRIAGDADSTIAFFGAYGLGKLDFLAGRYDDAVKALSELAEKHPASAWTNDALELAIEIKQALPEGTGALDLYRGAVLADERGEHAAAIDSLAALERRFPASSLAPRAIYMKGELEAERGTAGAAPPPALDEARADFARLAESFPLHDLAPRALERLAALAERERPDEAIAHYGRLMERYPDYPFMERVREKYVALGKSAKKLTPKKGSK